MKYFYLYAISLLMSSVFGTVFSIRSPVLLFLMEKRLALRRQRFHRSIVLSIVQAFESPICIRGVFSQQPSWLFLEIKWDSIQSSKFLGIFWSLTENSFKHSCTDFSLLTYNLPLPLVISSLQFPAGLYTCQLSDQILKQIRITDTTAEGSNWFSRK